MVAYIIIYLLVIMKDKIDITPVIYIAIMITVFALAI